MGPILDKFPVNINAWIARVRGLGDGGRAAELDLWAGEWPDGCGVV